MTVTHEPGVAVPDAGTPVPGGRPGIRRILVPIRSADQAVGPLAAAARVCGAANVLLCLVHVRIYDPPLRGSGRFTRRGAADCLGLRPAGDNRRHSGPTAGGRLGDRPAGVRLARRHDHHDPVSCPSDLPPSPRQRARSGHGERTARCSPSLHRGGALRAATPYRRRPVRQAQAQLDVLAGVVPCVVPSPAGSLQDKRPGGQGFLAHLGHGLRLPAGPAPGVRSCRRPEARHGLRPHTGGAWTGHRAALRRAGARWRPMSSWHRSRCPGVKARKSLHSSRFPICRNTRRRRPMRSGSPAAGPVPAAR